jgi:hypothetical protein
MRKQTYISFEEDTLPMEHKEGRVSSKNRLTGATGSGGVLIIKHTRIVVTESELDIIV